METSFQILHPVGTSSGATSSPRPDLLESLLDQSAGGNPVAGTMPTWTAAGSDSASSTRIRSKCFPGIVISIQAAFYHRIRLLYFAIKVAQPVPALAAHARSALTTAGTSLSQPSGSKTTSTPRPGRATPCTNGFSTRTLPTAGILPTSAPL